MCTPEYVQGGLRTSVGYPIHLDHLIPQVINHLHRNTPPVKDLANGAEISLLRELQASGTISALSDVLRLL